MKNEIMERAINLMNAIKRSEEEPEDKEMDIMNVQKYLKAFPAYFNSVINYAITGQMLSILYTGEAYRDKMQELDAGRRQRHIMATDAVNKLNRLAKYYDVEKIFRVDRDLDSGSVDDREYAVSMAYSFCTATFLDEVVRSGYNIGKEKNTMDQDLQTMVSHHLQFETDMVLEKE